MRTPTATGADRVFIGIDIGTSASKGALVSETGEVIASASHAYPIARLRSGWTEQNPTDWWAAIVRTTRDLLAASPIDPGTIRSLAFSGQLHGSVFLDQAAIDNAAAGPIDVIRPVILWNDQRTVDQCAEILDAVGGRTACVDAVGNTALPGFTLTKLLWLRAHEPDRFARVAAMVNPKDYAMLRCTGVLATDVGDASGTLAFDPVRSEWSRVVLDAVGIDAGLFPRAHESSDVVGKLTGHAAEELGLPHGLLVAAGSGDNMCGAVGAGAVTHGRVLA
ncbi:MAG: FGGY family carbohydrate kinase, partial [Planctomycetota bacterium]